MDGEKEAEANRENVERGGFVSERELDLLQGLLVSLSSFYNCRTHSRGDASEGGVESRSKRGCRQGSSSYTSLSTA